MPLCLRHGVLHQWIIDLLPSVMPSVRCRCAAANGMMLVAAVHASLRDYFAVASGLFVPDHVRGDPSYAYTRLTSLHPFPQLS